MHSISIHSGSWMQGMCMLSNSRRRRASAFLSAISPSFCRCFASRSIYERPSSPILVAKCCKKFRVVPPFLNMEKSSSCGISLG